MRPVRLGRCGRVGRRGVRLDGGELLRHRRHAVRRGRAREAARGAGAESGTERYDRQFTAAAKGAYLAVQALAPLVADGGAIVFTTVAADACRPGMPDAGAHAMTASAVHAFARVLAVELADRGVRVNVVSPGAIDTPDGVRGPRHGAAPLLGRRGSVDESVWPPPPTPCCWSSAPPRCSPSGWWAHSSTAGRGP
ncbi:SDR family oxidoreductase [Streptomyces sp. NPDC015350]|uniref:SDR family oxidoreductase n=1 Tax=Streptomyces sp. NPDC015350 TaxID=3364955 RepID=UPI0036FACC27